MQPGAPAPLRRSDDDRILTGVLGGIAKYFDLSADRLRLVYVVVSILSAAFPGILVYLALWFLIPRDDV
jgi:phage shock protein PspC (stress-responsive transcriptional regulator)